MLKKYLKLAGIGFLLGVTICAFITAVSGDPAGVSEHLVTKTESMRTALILQLLLSGIYGACCMGFTILYDLDRLPVTAATFLHCVICIVPFIPLSLFLGWYTSAGEVLIMTSCQIAAFFLIWLIMYLKYRKETAELNRIQKEILRKTDQIKMINKKDRADNPKRK